ALRPEPADFCAEYLLGQAGGLPEGRAARVPRARSGELHGTAGGSALRRPLDEYAAHGWISTVMAGAILHSPGHSYLKATIGSTLDVRRNGVLVGVMSSRFVSSSRRKFLMASANRPLPADIQ